MTSDEDLIRRMYDAVAAGDLKAFAEGLHPDVVWEHNLGGGSPEEGTYRGRAGVARLLERIIEPWEYIRIEPETIERRADGALVARGQMRFKHSTTAAEILTPFEQRIEFEDGLLVRGRMSFGPLARESRPQSPTAQGRSR